MSTASSKRARKRQRQQQSKGQTRGGVGREDLLPTVETGQEIPEQVRVIAAGCVIIAAAALRLFALGLKPMHHDEGVNGFFLMGLLRQGSFHYNPENYHGPTLYFLTLPFAFVADKLGALDNWTLRFVTAAFGVGTVWLVLLLRRYVGAFGALAGAALVAVSPACVFYSRYYIHEALFVFFTLGIVVAALKFYETGAAPYLLLATASAAMLFATKETAFISVGTLALAWVCAWLWVQMMGGGRARNRGESGLKIFVSGRNAPLAVLGSLALFAFLWVLFYSSFFTYWKGVFWDSFKAFEFWGKTGMSAFHEKPASTYVNWLLDEESPILVLACFGTLAALFERRKNRFAVFACAWAFGLLVAYSIIKYKTPWLVLSFVVPLCIAGGYFVQWFARRGREWLVAALVVAGLMLAACLYQTVVLNFFKYDDDTYPYVYSHTRREAVEMVREIELASELAGTKELAVSIAADEYWPLPWYFRDNKNVGYSGVVYPSYDPQATPVIIGRKNDDPKHDSYKKLVPLLAGKYTEVGMYPLRPGVDLVLFIRSDIAPK